MYAQRFGQNTPLPSMQLCIENLDQAGGCYYNYACAYTDTISWAAPNEPLPMIRDPRIAFDMLFGAGGNNAGGAFRAARPTSSILDWISGDSRRRMQRAARTVRPPASRPVCDGHPRSRAPHPGGRGAQLSGETRELPDAPTGVPDSFEEHMKLMFDLQVLALQSDMTRVISFKTGRDASSRVVPGERHRARASTRRRTTAGPRRRVMEFNMINRYHVSMLPYFLDKMKNAMDGDGACSSRR